MWDTEIESTWTGEGPSVSCCRETAPSAGETDSSLSTFSFHVDVHHVLVARYSNMFERSLSVLAINRTWESPILGDAALVASSSSHSPPMSTSRCAGPGGREKGRPASLEPARCRGTRRGQLEGSPLEARDSALGHLNDYWVEMSKWAWGSHLSHLGVGEWQEESQVRGTSLAGHSLPCGGRACRDGDCWGGLQAVCPWHLRGGAGVWWSDYLCTSVRRVRIAVQVLIDLMSLGEEKLGAVSPETWAEPDHSSAHPLDGSSMFSCWRPWECLSYTSVQSPCRSLRYGECVVWWIWSSFCERVSKTVFQHFTQMIIGQ